MTETIAREKAMTTLAKYGLTLCESWSGYAEVMHAYHAPNLSYWITWEEYLERIDTVQRTKLCNEIPVRLAAMQPVGWEWKQTPARARLNEARARLNEASARWNEARARLNEASARWNEARARLNEASARLKEASARWNEARARLNEASDRLNEARARWNEARARWNEASARLNKAHYRWLAEDTESIRSIHDANCIGCTWDWERREMTFEVTQ